MCHKQDEFDNFFDYEQALLDWKGDVELALGTLRLPTIVGRHYYRPRVSTVRYYNYPMCIGVTHAEDAVRMHASSNNSIVIPLANII